MRTELRPNKRGSLMFSCKYAKHWYGVKWTLHCRETTTYVRSCVRHLLRDRGAPCSKIVHTVFWRGACHWQTAPPPLLLGVFSVYYRNKCIQNENRIETPTNEDLICFHSVLLVPKYVVVGREGRMLPVGVECGSGRWFP
jgi:hypothetical protein